LGWAVEFIPQERTWSVRPGMSENGMDRPCSRPEPLRE
jgi:hypothetical protein